MKDDENIGEQFQELTKYSRQGTFGGAKPAQSPEAKP